MNQKFSPQFFEDEGSYQNLTALIRSYFSLDGHHIQFNVVNAETLRDAQKHPELHRDLIVRVAGYSDYFNDLGDLFDPANGKPNNIFLIKFSYRFGLK